MEIATNYLHMKTKAKSSNEQFLRSAIASFTVELNPTVEEINDIKTAVSEAVTNCVVHAYQSKGEGDIIINVSIFESKTVTIEIIDFGVGIEDIKSAKKPFFTTKPTEERAGMGFCVMEALMDKVDVSTNENGGITILMTKTIA